MKQLTWFRLGMVLLTALPFRATAQIVNRWPSLPRDLPKDIRAFIERRAECNFWAGELTPNDADRNAEADANSVALRCEALGRDEVALNRRYGSNPAYRKIIGDSASWLPQ